MARGFSRVEMAVLVGGVVSMVLGVGVVIYETEHFCVYRGADIPVVIERYIDQMEAKARGEPYQPPYSPVQLLIEYPGGPSCWPFYYPKALPSGYERFLEMAER